MPSTEELQALVAANTWSALLPEILLGVLALALLAVDAFAPRRQPQTLLAAMVGQAAILAWLLFAVFTAEAGEARVYFAGSVVQTALSDWMRIFFVTCSLFTTHLALVYLRNREYPRVEYIHVSLVVTASFMLLVQSGNFLLFFVALETLTIGFYVLVAFARTSRFSLEAGLKYLVMGGFSSGILLFGIALLYGVAGNPLLPATAVDPLNFIELGAFIGAVGIDGANAAHPLVIAGSLLVLTGVLFKVGAVPFQIWVPDVYQGAPTPTTAALAVASKAGGFFVLFILLSGPFLALESLLFPVLAGVTAVTLVFGNIAPLGQQNVKRIMGLSGVAHAGVLLLGMLAAYQVPWAFHAVLFYLLVYAIASFAVFEVMAHLAPDEDADQDISHYRGLLKRHPLLGSALVIGLGSLAGIPPLAGFIAKVLIFVAAFQAGLYTLLAVAILGVVISIYYYFGWMRAAVLRELVDDGESGREPLRVTIPTKVILVALALITVVGGIFQAGLTKLVGLS
ncbi:MAG: NADH-quinone oxidoreductase subunit N [Opitutales bacterium]|nr:NADH-quinone oxidoreductase subunit N [Opitutales bacterium]